MNDNELELQPHTISDLVTSKVVYIDGKKVGGVLGLNIGCDIENIQTTVTVRFAIKNGSLHIKDFDDGSKRQRIEFSTVNEVFK